MGSESGFSIIEVTISLLLSSIAVAAIFTITFHQNQQLLIVKATASRDEIISQVRAAGTAKYVNFSATHADNKDLSTCLSGVDGTNCEALEVYPLKIYGPAGASDVISGFQSSPVRYNVDGQPCSAGAAASKVCPFEVFTAFRTQCRTNPKVSFTPPETCPAQKPEFLEIFYTIQSASPSIIGVEHPASRMAPIEGSIIVEL